MLIKRSGSAVRTEGSVLVARMDGEYYFVQSVFKHNDDFAGCTGMGVYPVTEEGMDDMLLIDNLVGRYGDHWEERYKVDAVCESCEGLIDEGGCEDCGYPSQESWCADIAEYDGSDAVIDSQDQCVDALNEVCDDEVEYADCVRCGRIFGSMTITSFDEVYNMKALVACLAFEDGAVSYNYARRAIFGVK